MWAHIVTYHVNFEGLNPKNKKLWQKNWFLRLLANFYGRRRQKIIFFLQACISSSFILPYQKFGQNSKKQKSYGQKNLKKAYLPGPKVKTQNWRFGGFRILVRVWGGEDGVSAGWAAPGPWSGDEGGCVKSCELRVGWLLQAQRGVETAASMSELDTGSRGYLHVKLPAPGSGKRQGGLYQE